MAQTYIIIKQDGPMKSKVNKGSYYWNITLRGKKDYRTYRTYIDTDMKNIEHWITILENPDQEFEITGLNFKDEKKGILDADSKPEIVGGNSQFGNLFSFDE